MKVLLMFIVALLITSCIGVEGHFYNVYVSPKGNDSNSGLTKKSSVKTLEKARDIVRNLRLKDSSKKAYTVYLGGGIYKLEKTFVLEPKDSNTIYQAIDGEIPVISGGEAIHNWKPLKENVRGLAKAAKGKVWYADISKGWIFHYMFVNGQYAERSKSKYVNWRQWSRDHKIGKPEKKGQLITLTKNKSVLKDLPSNGDAEVIVIMAQYGVMGNGIVTDVNPEKGTFRWNSNQLNLRRSRNQAESGYCFANAVCLMTRAGTWAVDSHKGRVYYWPKEGENMLTSEVIVPKLYELVKMQGVEIKGPFVENITLNNLTFAYTDRLPENKWPSNWLFRQWENVDGMIYMEGVKNNTIENCRLLYSGSYGITMRHTAEKNTIKHSEIAWTGSGGVFLEGYGPGTLNVNKKNIIEYNYIHDHGLGNYWHSPSIQVYQSGENKIIYNLLQRSAYSSISIVGCHPKYFNKKSIFFNDTPWQGQFETWNHMRVRTEDFSKKIQDGIRKGTYKFNRKTIKPYLHTNRNYVAYNVISEPHSKLNEGGAIYAWCCGKGNVWTDNVVFKSRGMPGSSIFALDDIVEYTTVKNNVFWIEGRILDGIGARRNERGNKIFNNYRVNYKKEFAQKRGHNKVGPGKWAVNNSDRKVLDDKIKIILDKVKSKGGWLGNPKIGIPKPGEKINIYGEALILPKGSHVTIEE